jgi:hypothetical protein
MVEKNTKRKKCKSQKEKTKKEKGTFGRQSIRLGAFEGGNFKR